MNDSIQELRNQLNERKSDAEIEDLKKNWLQDPCWDIEDTEGFEAHREELLAFHKEQDQLWQEKREKRTSARREKVMLATGLGKADGDILDSLHTWSEVEQETRDAESHTNDYQVAMTAALVRATLLQAAQLKRIADALETIADGDALEQSVRIWGTGK